MVWTRTLLGAAVVLSLIRPAASAQATPEGASALLHTFEIYVGKRIVGESGGLTVAPDGESYLVSLDVRKMLRPLGALGLNLDTTPLSFHATPRDDGTWHIGDATIPSQFRLGFADRTTSISFQGFHFDGVYDPKIAGFSTLTAGYDKAATEQADPAVDTSVSYADVTLTQAGTAAGDDAADVRQHGSFGPFVESMRFKSGPGVRSGDRSGFKLTLKSASTTGDLTIDALRGQALLDLWAYLIAHPSLAEMADAAADLKARLTALLPVWETFDDSATLRDFTIDFPFGPFSVRELALQIGGTGAAVDSHYETSWRASGFSAPQAALKPWQAQLVPTDLDFGVSVSGLNFDAVAREAIEGLDLGGSEAGISAEGKARIASAFLLNGPIKITIAPSHLASALLSVEASGMITVTPAETVAQIDVQAKGLDAAIDAAPAGADADPLAVSARQGLQRAKALAKPGTDGASSWHIEFATRGKPMVNGAPFGDP